MQLFIQVVQNRLVGEQETHWLKPDKRLTSLIWYSFCLSRPNAPLAVHYDGFVPHE